MFDPDLIFGRDSRSHEALTSEPLRAAQSPVGLLPRPIHGGVQCRSKLGVDHEVGQVVEVGRLPVPGAAVDLARAGLPQSTTGKPRWLRAPLVDRI